MKYEELPPIGRDELEDAMCRDPDGAAGALLRMALNERDWRWAEQKCLGALKDSRRQVRAAAITGLGHVARIHRLASIEVVVPALRKLTADPELGGIAEDALDDILRFTADAPA